MLIVSTSEITGWLEAGDAAVSQSELMDGLGMELKSKRKMVAIKLEPLAQIQAMSSMTCVASIQVNRLTMTRLCMID